MKADSRMRPRPPCSMTGHDLTMNLPTSSFSAPEACAEGAQRPPRCHALLPCAGHGSRAGAGGPKQYRPLAGRPLVWHTLAAFEPVARVSQVWLVLAPGDGFDPGPGLTKVRLAGCGGASRAESVWRGLQAMRDGGAADHDWVLVHDAARCLVRSEEIDVLIDACWNDPVGGLLALPLPDTLKQASGEARVLVTVEREHKWLAQTPQMFRLGMLLKALDTASAQGFVGVTDEASALERVGHQPRLVRGSAQNLKVTYPEDFALAEAVLRSRA